MAVTAIWSVKGSVGKVLRYVANPAKTWNGQYAEAAKFHTVERVLEYDADAMKLHLSALLDAGTDGQSLQQSFTEANADGLFVVTLRAHCLENIAVDRTIN